VAALRVLVVEDEDDIRESVCATLRDEGYEVTSAATLAETRAKLETETFDALALDLWLPDGNGDLILRALAGRASPPAVLLASAAAAAPGIARKFGVAHVRKPYDLGPFVDALKAAIANRMTPCVPPPSDRDPL